MSWQPRYLAWESQALPKWKKFQTTSLEIMFDIFLIFKEVCIVVPEKFKASFYNVLFKDFGYSLDFTLSGPRSLQYCRLCFLGIGFSVICERHYKITTERPNYGMRGQQNEGMTERGRNNRNYLGPIQKPGFYIWISDPPKNISCIPHLVKIVFGSFFFPSFFSFLFHLLIFF